jgi:two-component system, NtrC family, sensor kinase
MPIIETSQTITSTLKLPSFHNETNRDECDRFMSLAGENVGLAAFEMISTLYDVDIESKDMQAWLLRSLCHLFKVEASVLVLLEENDNTFATKYILQEASGELFSVSLKLETGLIAESILSRTDICVNYPAEDHRLRPGVDCVKGIAVCSMICAPLISNGHVLGALQVFNKQDSPFDLQDQELFRLTANSIAVAFQNNHMIQQLKVSNADLEAKHWELANSRNTLRALFDSTPVSMYMIDQRYRMVAINKSRAATACTDPRGLVGKYCYETLFHINEPCPGCRVDETLFKGVSTERIDRRWDKDDKFSELEINTYPIFDKDSHVTQAYIFEEDVTDKRRMEASLAQSEKLAAVGQLTAGVAHEINNPLTAIIANIQMMQRILPDDPELQEMAELITKASNRAAQVVRNLLDFTRKEQYEFRPTNINETLDKTISLLQHEFLTRSIDFSFTPDENLPEIPASFDHLQGVWLNFLINAIDSLENHPGEIRVSTGVCENEIHVKIIDKGTGIPQDQISRIFEPFYTTKAPGKGTGLGLPICHRIIGQHGGRILVDSHLGSGTIFTIIFPIK